MDDIDEKIFHEVSRMLQKQHVNFWVCHGTLLGIIREGRLLPWDHDIDFAVWESETTRDEIINIFTKASPAEKTDMINIMKEVDPPNGNRYEGVNK